ncbi:unnamed protein product [Mucor hiemalis]
MIGRTLSSLFHSFRNATNGITMSSSEMLGVFTPAQKALVRGWWKKVTVAHPKARNFKEMKVPTVGKLKSQFNPT